MGRRGGRTERAPHRLLGPGSCPGASAAPFPAAPHFARDPRPLPAVPMWGLLGGVLASPGRSASSRPRGAPPPQSPAHVLGRVPGGAGLSRRPLPKEGERRRHPRPPSRPHFACPGPLPPRRALFLPPAPQCARLGSSPLPAALHGQAWGEFVGCTPS